MLFDICAKHGLHLDHEPEYGGRKYLEKQDYILMKQKGLTEPEAHHLLQKHAMDHGLKMADCAADIVRQGKLR